MSDGATLPGADKAAVLLLSLGTEAATAVLRHLGETEVRRVSQALARVRSVEPLQVSQVHREFEEKLGGTSGLAVDGREFARTVVGKALADQTSPAASQRTDILAALEGAGDGALGEVLGRLPADRIATLLSGEHPQVASVILAHLDPTQAGAVLGFLPETQQGDVIERMARLESIPPDLVAEIGAVMREQVKDLLRPTGTVVGGPKAVAEIMNHADKAIEGRIFEELETRDAALAATIKNLMFTFEDCLKLDNRSLQTLLKEVAREDLLLALKTASPALNDKIFSNVSSRAAEILREDMSSSGPVKLKDVEAAQLKVVATLRELEAEGKVVVAGSGKDDVLV